VKLFIPACGDRLKLTTEWSFAVFLESRNIKFAEVRNLLNDSEKGQWSVWEGERYSGRLAVRPFTLPAGSVLEVDRVYIRATSKDGAHQGVDNNYDSITFKIVGEKHSRFWVKLADANSIECELESTFRDRAAAKSK
jgi:hypothetical protein